LGKIGFKLAAEIQDPEEIANALKDYNDIVEDMRLVTQISEKEYTELRGATTLSQISDKIYTVLGKNGLRNEDVEDRLRNWANPLLRRDKMPQLPNSWDRIKSIWVRFMWKADPFYYTWEQYTYPNIDQHFSSIGKPEKAPGSGRSILYQQKRGRSDEFENLIAQLLIKDWISEREAMAMRNLRTTDHPQKFSDKQQQVTIVDPVTGLEITVTAAEAAVVEVDKWVNQRMQTVYHTLEGTLEIRKSYRLLAEKFFPQQPGESNDVYNQRMEEKVNEKFEVIIAIPFPTVVIFWPKPRKMIWGKPTDNGH